MDSKFRPTFFKIIPTGSCHFKIRATETKIRTLKYVESSHYMGDENRDTKLCSVLALVGVDTHEKFLSHLEGTITITNHQTGDMGCLYFIPYKTTKHFTKIKGDILDKDGATRVQVKGDWTSNYTYRKVGEEAWKEVWNLPADILEDKKKYYGFSTFAIQLNEEEEGVAPTDSRNRPDQRFLEHGDVEGAAEEKLRLEEKQRARRKAAKNAEPQHLTLGRPSRALARGYFVTKLFAGPCYTSPDHGENVNGPETHSLTHPDQGQDNQKMRAGPLFAYIYYTKTN
eukprot:sb/3467785/